MFQIVGFFPDRADVNQVIEYATETGKANRDASGTMICTMMMYNTVAKLANARIAELEGTLDAVRTALSSARDTGGEHAIPDDVFDLLREQLGMSEPEGEGE